MDLNAPAIMRVNAKGASAEGIEDLAARKAKAEIDAQLAAMNESRDRFVSEFAYTFASGVRAAFSGDLADFAAQRLQEAMYSRLYDLFARLGEQLFNSGQGNGGGLGGLISGGFGAIFGDGSNPAPVGFGGGKAAGGPVQPGKFYAWQEQGREFFAPTVPGEVLREGAMGGGGSGPISIRLEVTEGQMFETRVVEVSAPLAERAAVTAISAGRQDMAKSRARSVKRLR